VQAVELLLGDAPFITDASAPGRFSSLPAELAACAGALRRVRGFAGASVEAGLVEHRDERRAAAMFAKIREADREPPAPGSTTGALEHRDGLARAHSERLRGACNPHPDENPATDAIEKPRVSGAFP